jgi:hypothetical protein
MTLVALNKTSCPGLWCVSASQPVITLICQPVDGTDMLRQLADLWEEAEGVAAEEWHTARLLLTEALARLKT